MVREYGLLFEVVVALAAERGEQLPEGCFHVLARCLFDGAADATAQYARQRDEERARVEARSFAFFAHELRNPLSSVMMAWRVLNLNAPLPGRAAATLGRNLDRLVHLVDRSLVEAKLRASTDPPELQRERLPCAELLTEVEADARPHAEARDVELTVEPWEGEIEVDRRLLFSALSNVVRTAVKFTRHAGRVTLRAFRRGDDVVFEVEDECGGLAEGAEHRLFEAFRQESGERSGFGLGLAIARHAVEAQGGQVEVTNRPGQGCVFRVRLPAAPPAAA
jgi:signal transduction histidine kinase